MIFYSSWNGSLAIVLSSYHGERDIKDEGKSTINMEKSIEFNIQKLPKFALVMLKLGKNRQY